MTAWVLIALMVVSQTSPLRGIIDELKKQIDALEKLVPDRVLVITVPDGGDLQAALNTVPEGGTINLTPDAIYTGNFVIRRNAFTLTTPGSTKGRLRSGNGSTILTVAPGVLDVTVRNVAIGPFTGNDAVSIGLNDTTQTALTQQPRRIVLDAVLIEGEPGEAKRGVGLHCADCAVTHSTIRNFQKVGQDTQAIWISNGEGPFLILDNDLEAAGENIMVGGARVQIPGLVPANIRIENNRLTKDLAWKGTGVTAKNLIELKSGRQVTILNNSLRYSWIGQGSYAIMVTPSDADGGLNPSLSVEDVTIQGNHLFDVGAGINIIGVGQNAPTAQTKNVRILQNWIQTNSCTYGGQGWPVFLSRQPATVVIEQNTIEMACGAMIVMQEGPPISGFRFVGNLVPRSGLYGFSGTANGTTQHRALMWQVYYPGGVISSNAFGSFPTPSNLPGNLHLATAAVTVTDGYGTGTVAVYGRPR